MSGPSGTEPAPASQPRRPIPDPQMTGSGSTSVEREKGSVCVGGGVLTELSVSAGYADAVPIILCSLC